jgi:hypothetical protein
MQAVNISCTSPWSAKTSEYRAQHPPSSAATPPDPSESLASITSPGCPEAR